MWRAVEFVGHFHPLLVHLPIGLLLLVALAEASMVLRRASDRYGKALDTSRGPVLALLLVAMLAASAVGLMLASDGGYPPRLIAIHRALGLVGVAGAAAAVALWRKRRRGAYRVALFATLGVVSIGAHFGGSITHGEKWLSLPSDPAPAPPATVTVAAAEPLVFHDKVLPILVERCAKCHGETKSSSGLRLDSFAALQKGSNEGPVVVAGDGANSVLIKRMMLPADDDEHMPPSPKKPPSAEEIALMKWWIDRGASETLRVHDALPPTAARDVLAGPDIR